MKISLTRSRKNPILRPREEIWWEKGGVFNPGAVARDGKIFLLYRGLAEIHYSNLGLAILSDPETVAKQSFDPVIKPDDSKYWELLGVEDPRIVFWKKRFWITYAGASVSTSSEEETLSDPGGIPWRVRGCLAETKDFVKIKKHGVILPGVNTKNLVLFPEKIKGSHYLLHRVFPDIWITKSRRLKRFKKGQPLCGPRINYWDNERVGAGAPPLKTRLGWLEFYHGVGIIRGKREYSLGILILDPLHPEKILYRSPEPILEPEEEYEKKGYVNNVVFTCGAIEYKGRYWVYYGGGDRTVNVAYIEKEKLLEEIEKEIKNK